MKNIQLKFESIEIQNVFDSYPPGIRSTLMNLRQLIIDTAKVTEPLTDFQETLKWGEPSYTTKQGSTIRIAWKKATPKKYYIYFHCKTKLIDTFKELYRDELLFEGNRAIVFDENDEIPIDVLANCIKLSLTYHNIKHLPLLGE